MITMGFIAKDSVDPFEAIITKANNDDKAMQLAVHELGIDTAEKMKSVINENKVRPQADEPTTLEDNIDVEFFEGGWGVGDIDKLNDVLGRNTWAAINFGSAHMVGRRVPGGMFSPGEPSPSVSNFREGRWKVAEKAGGQGGGGFNDPTKKHYSFIVKNPIPPMNYIDITSFWLYGELNNLSFV